MDERFPKYLRWLVSRLSLFAVPNMAILVCGLTALAYVTKNVMGTPVDRFMFDPERVLGGEWWRLFAFPISGGLDNPIWFLFYLLYVYFVLDILEKNWGSSPLTLFLFLSYLASVGASLITLQPLSIWFYVLENVSLAFGTLFPDFEFYLFFILPVRAKWLALLAGGQVIFKMVTGGAVVSLFLAIVFLPYLIFFGPFVARSCVARVKLRKHKDSYKKKFDSDMWR